MYLFNYNVPFKYKHFLSSFFILSLMKITFKIMLLLWLLWFSMFYFCLIILYKQSTWINQLSGIDIYSPVLTWVSSCQTTEDGEFNLYSPLRIKVVVLFHSEIKDYSYKLI